jgi:hypothetical protein
LFVKIGIVVIGGTVLRRKIINAIENVGLIITNIARTMRGKRKFLRVTNNNIYLN